MTDSPVRNEKQKFRKCRMRPLAARLQGALERAHPATAVRDASAQTPKTTRSHGLCTHPGQEAAMSVARFFNSALSLVLQQTTDFRSFSLCGIYLLLQLLFLS